MDNLEGKKRPFPLISEAEGVESPVNIREEPLKIPAYRMGDSYPHPMFYRGVAFQGAQAHIYPYALADKLTGTREDKTYKAVFLENRYIKVCVLPEIGGRIFSALDKTDNYDFFYRQHVIKPALIGVLGAWISGGVEWNFPHHHIPTTFMPVDYTLEEDSDGSKTLWVGDTDLRHRMRWRVGITLHPDKSYIEVTAKLFNSTPLAHSFLYWANVAVHSNPAYQIVFPPSTEYAVYHCKEQFSSWPISREVFNGTDYTQGVDVSWWKNHPAPNSLFAWDYKEDFLLGYDHKKEAGTLYLANHHIAPGKKFFLWGNGPQGRMWDKILTDTDGPYIELMCGGYSDNQPDYSWAQPYEFKTIKQFWYPVRQIGGVKNANLKAAVNLEITPKKTIIFGFNTSAEYKGARVLLRAKEKIIFEHRIDISPEKPFVKEIPLPSGVKEKELKASLYSAGGQELVAYRPLKKEGAAMPKPVEPPPAPEKVKTVEELYLIGLRLEQFHNPAVEPEPYYKEALRRDPDDYRTNTALAILYCKRGMFEKAEENLNRAIKRVTKNYTRPKDTEAHYYLGLALKAQSMYDAAYDAFFKATWSYPWYSAAYYSLAELASLKEDFPKALEFINRSLSTNGLNTKALNLKASLLRRLGRLEEAEKLVSGIISADPLDFRAGNELFLIKSRMGMAEEAVKGLDALKQKMRDNVQSYLEVACEYGNSGLWDEAIETLLRMVDGSKKKNKTYPMIYYYLGYFYEKKGRVKKALKHYRLGAKAPTDFCFPSRLESVDVFRQAIKHNPEDGHAHYYLGNLFYFLNQFENAIKEWEKSRNLDSTFSMAHRNLGLAYARSQNNIRKAIGSLEKAVACNKEDPILYYELDELYEAGGISPRKRLKLLKENQKTVLKRDDVFLRQIILYVVLGQYDKALNLLMNHHFYVREGEEVRVHNVYVDAHLLKGRTNLKAKRYPEALKDYEAALEYPEDLGTGKPYDGGRASEVYYLIGNVYEALGDTAKAREFYKKSVAGQHNWASVIGQVIDWAGVCYHQGLAFRKLNQKVKSYKIFDGLLEFGRKRLKSGPMIDFFAKFGGKESEQSRLRHAHYLMALGYLGKGKKQKAKAEFGEVLKIDPSHIGAITHLLDQGALKT